MNEPGMFVLTTIAILNIFWTYEGNFCVIQAHYKGLYAAMHSLHHVGLTLESSRENIIALSLFSFMSIKITKIKEYFV